MKESPEDISRIIRGLLERYRICGHRRIGPTCAACQRKRNKDPERKAAHSKWEQARQAKLRAQGLCIRCRNPRDCDSKNLCHKCLLRARSYYQRKLGHKPWSGRFGRKPMKRHRKEPRA